MNDNIQYLITTVYRDGSRNRVVATLGEMKANPRLTLPSMTNSSITIEPV